MLQFFKISGRNSYRSVTFTLRLWENGGISALLQQGVANSEECRASKIPGIGGSDIGRPGSLILLSPGQRDGSRARNRSRKY